MRLAERLYRWLVKLYPAGFRDDYGTPMHRQFKDDAAQVRGGFGWLAFWIHTVVDVARTAPPARAREIGQDARHAWRLWRLRPIHSGFAIAVMAIAIGATTGVFSVLNALLLRSLPFHEPERLAAMRMFLPGGLGSSRLFHEWRRSSAYAADALMYTSGEVTLEGASVVARSRLTETSWNFFDVLGVQPNAGRAFVDGEDRPGTRGVAVIGHGLWQQLFGGQAAAIGSTVRVNGVPLTIVGVAPPGFDYPQRTTIWSSTCFDLKGMPRTGVRFWESVIRLRDGMSWEQARQAFEAEAFRERPERRTREAPNRPALIPLRDQLAGPVRQASFVLMAGVALLLALACANIANFLLARTLSRADELSIRVALGASRARVVQQLVTETVMLSAVGATLGLVVAAWVTRTTMVYQPSQLASQAYSIVDWQVLAFALALAAGTGLLFSAGPALVVSRIGPGSTRTMTPPRSQTLVRNGLIATQIAVTIVLLTGSIALGRTFLRLVATDNGFTIDSIATMNISFAGTTYRDGAALAYYDRVVEAVSGVPSVTSVSATQFLPLANEAYGGAMYNLDGTGVETLVTLVPVADGYFRTLGTVLLAGREYTRADLGSREPLIIVNEPLARLFGDPAAVVGRMLTSSRVGSARIIGVVRGMRDSGPAYSPNPQAYTPTRTPKALTIVARTSGPAASHVAAIRDTVAAVDSHVPVYNVKTMSERLDETLARPKFYATAVVFFGGLALLLSIAGIYGVVSSACSARLREMGIRLALGTTPRRLRGTLLAKSLLIVFAGATIGAVAARASGQYVQDLIRGAGAGLTLTVALAVAGTLAVAAAATWVATRRLSALDVVDILRRH